MSKLRPDHLSGMIGMVDKYGNPPVRAALQAVDLAAADYPVRVVQRWVEDHVGPPGGSPSWKALLEEYFRKQTYIDCRTALPHLLAQAAALPSSAKTLADFLGRIHANNCNAPQWLEEADRVLERAEGLLRGTA